MPQALEQAVSEGARNSCQHSFSIANAPTSCQSSLLMNLGHTKVIKEKYDFVNWSLKCPNSSTSAHGEKEALDATVCVFYSNVSKKI